jgi:hypothetical protein
LVSALAGWRNLSIRVARRRVPVVSLIPSFLIAESMRPAAHLTNAFLARSASFLPVAFPKPHSFAVRGRAFLSFGRLRVDSVARGNPPRPASFSNCSRSDRPNSRQDEPTNQNKEGKNMNTQRSKMRTLIGLLAIVGLCLPMADGCHKHSKAIAAELSIKPFVLAKGVAALAEDQDSRP